MEPRSLDLVKKSFASYLTQPEWNWSWFVTQTFDYAKCSYLRRDGKRALHSQILRESWEVFTDACSQSGSLVYGFVFGEAHRSGEPHWHAVVHCSDALLGTPRWRPVWQSCFARFGRIEFRCIEKLRSVKADEGMRFVSDGISRYLCKYVAKETRVAHAWWDFTGMIDGSVVDASRIRQVISLPTSDPY